MHTKSCTPLSTTVLHSSYGVTVLLRHCIFTFPSQNVAPPTSPIFTLWHLQRCILKLMRLTRSAVNDFVTSGTFVVTKWRQLFTHALTTTQQCADHTNQGNSRTRSSPWRRARDGVFVTSLTKVSFILFTGIYVLQFVHLL